MSKKLVLATMLFVATAMPALAQSLAQSTCAEPPAPASVNGAALTADQLRTAVAAVKNFMAQSDVYQDCLIKDVEAQKQQATAAGQKFDPSIQTAAQRKIDANQTAKQKAGDSVNAAVNAYKKAHAS